jgi:hypothetical protein
MSVNPETKTQNLLLWGAALGIALLLSFVSGVMTHWPEAGGIDWRGVWLDVGQTVVTVVPIVAAGLGLPRLGREDISALVSQVGRGTAKAALEVAATRQVADDPLPPIHPEMTPGQTDQLLTLVNQVGPLRAIRALNDEQYRDPHREDAP